MKIVITNAEEADMPQEMADNCCQLIAWRIQKLYFLLPNIGDEITILYSEKDPLQTTDLVDDNAYFIDFEVMSVESVAGQTNTDNATVYVELAF
ncbi:hypothetical protein C7N43_03300 [Sphingobacteriales bacterium UPWRP_1]|nr:hypothetical protein BVG80_08700 [Sphingobacteriales bacterium TSM_CSM]PSJ78504.1 hypothetical protein C7N43_03300 [Sphingobacteriales bacterium UPWRP_1]